MNFSFGRGAPAALVLAAALLAPRPLHAQAQGGEQAGQQPGQQPGQVDAQAFHPAPDRAGDFLTAHSGRLLPAHGFSGGVLSHYARRPLVLQRPERLSPDYAGPYSGDVVTDRAVLHGLFAYGLTDWLQLGADLPVVLTQSGDDRTGLGDPGEVSRAAGLGDLRLLAKLRVFDHPAPAGASSFHVALVADAGLPTGDAARYQGGTTRLAPTLAAEWRSDFGARVAGNLGYAWRADEASFGETRVEGGPSWALAVALPVWGRREAQVEFLGEVAGELTTELQLGVRGRYREWIVTASGGPGLSDDDVTPDYRLLLSAAYRGGSPDARDADGDGLDDDRDGCPAQPEDVDGFQDDDGCPDPDNDGDGVPDARDACPLAAEDIDRFEDGDGCPDADNDGDGIVDAVDACPLSPEDRDGYGDADGCPEADNDGDGIVDERDRCPLDPEDPDGELDEDGCPDVKAAVRVDVVVFFARDQDTLSPEAKVQLDRVAHSLIAMPDALHVWINGHADDTGRAEHNQQLGMRRAEAVRQYLLERGVPAERMTAQSYGDTKNVFAGDSDEDRLANRHVDFRVGPRTLSAPDSAQPPAGEPSAQESER